MNKTKNVLLFGAGNCGRRHFHDIEDDILCFVDNDPIKQGSEIYGKTIIAPEEINNFKFDSIIIASIYESEIKRQLIEMGLGDKISVPFTHKLASETLPVNFNDYDCSKEKIHLDARYALSIATGYIKKIHGGIKAIKNKSILELGPGINFGTALILLCWGAKKVAVSDRFLAQYNDNYHSQVYQEIVNLLTVDYPNINTSPITDCIKNISHKTQGLYTIQSSLEKLSSIFPNEFDITLSNAVFEHLYNPMSAFESLYDCMTDGAIGHHQVDFRDHRNFDKPLEFLLLDELSFHALMQDASCEFGNRIRPYQMQYMFEMVGFKDISVDINMTANNEYLSNFLVRLRPRKSSNFSEIDAEHLKPISGNFLIHK